MAHPNEELVRRGYAAFNKGDMDTLGEIMAADVVHRVPGDNQLSGEYKGQGEVFGYYAQLGELTGGTVSANLEEAKAQGDDTVVARHRNRGQRGGKSLDAMETLTFRVSDGKIAELDEKPDDQAATDDFWA
jgi:hypothetical protein